QKNGALPTQNGREPGNRLLAEARIARRADALIASSPTEAAQLRRYLGAKEARTHIVPCGVDLQRFVPLPRGPARALLGLPEDTMFILSVGRVEPIKGLDRLVEALAALKAMRPDLPVRAIHVGGAIRAESLIGNGRGYAPEDFASPLQRAEVRRVLRLAKKAGIADRLRFAGAKTQKELTAYYSAADVLAIPSRHETFGMVSLEAAACGLPAVAFEVGGLPQAIESGRSGLLIPDGDAAAFSRALLSMWEAPETRARLGERAQERALNFPWSAIASKEMVIWNGLLQNRRPPAEDIPNGSYPEGAPLREAVTPA
ncbi:MAG: glycosyltransferase, partial [bacterium]